MADKYHNEASRTLEGLGFFCDHHADGMIRKFGGQTSHAQPESGRADLVFVGNGMGGAVEVKTASAQRYFYYDNEKTGWKPAQRAWAKVWDEKFGNRYWLWITFGGRANAKAQPRMTILVEREQWMLIEEQVLIPQAKKSLIYEFADSMDFAKLIWAGDQRWTIPEDHLFWKHHRRNNVR